MPVASVWNGPEASLDQQVSSQEGNLTWGMGDWGQNEPRVGLSLLPPAEGGLPHSCTCVWGLTLESETWGSNALAAPLNLAATPGPQGEPPGPTTMCVSCSDTWFATLTCKFSHDQSWTSSVHGRPFWEMEFSLLSWWRTWTVIKLKLTSERQFVTTKSKCQYKSSWKSWTQGWNLWNEWQMHPRSSDWFL